eukprot:1195204-Prorocentrum_minimum.AAC.7
MAVVSAPAMISVFISSRRYWSDMPSPSPSSPSSRAAISFSRSPPLVRPDWVSRWALRSAMIA